MNTIIHCFNNLVKHNTKICRKQMEDSENILEWLDELTVDSFKGSNGRYHSFNKHTPFLNLSNGNSFPSLNPDRQHSVLLDDEIINFTDFINLLKEDVHNNAAEADMLLRTSLCQPIINLILCYSESRNGLMGLTGFMKPHLYYTIHEIHIKFTNPHKTYIFNKDKFCNCVKFKYQHCKWMFKFDYDENYENTHQLTAGLYKFFNSHISGNKLKHMENLSTNKRYYEKLYKHMSNSTG